VYERSKLKDLPAYIMCDRISRGSADALKRAFVNRAPGGGPPADVRAQAEEARHSVCAARCAGPPVTAVDALLRDPTVVLRLVPLAILSLAFPGLMIPVLFPKPRKPEVEMSDDEGEQGKGETKGEDDETVGCIPGG